MEDEEEITNYEEQIIFLKGKNKHRCCGQTGVWSILQRLKKMSDKESCLRKAKAMRGSVLHQDSSHNPNNHGSPWGRTVVSHRISKTSFWLQSRKKSKITKLQAEKSNKGHCSSSGERWWCLGLKQEQQECCEKEYRKYLDRTQLSNGADIDVRKLCYV